MSEIIIRKIPAYYSAPSSGAACVMLMFYSSQAPTAQELASAKNAAKTALEASGAIVANADETALILPPTTLNSGETLKLKVDAQLSKIVPDATDDLQEVDALADLNGLNVLPEDI